MRPKPFISVLLAAMLAVSSIGAAMPRATEKRGCKYFRETGHYVCGQYLDFFRAKGGLEIFGFPLTEAFQDPTHGGLQVQYFQRARMELHPDDSHGHIMLGLLVDELGFSFPAAGPDQIPASNSESHHYFPETGHVVSYAFLDAFREKGGLEIFGYPRSEFFFEDGTVVQYFQRARMHWHRDKPEGSQIELANLGEIYLERFGVPGNHDQAVPAPARMRSETLPTATAESCRYFAETGHYVCDQFLQFFDEKGQIEVFGYPLTEAFTDPDHGGLHVQYFQRARMELHPHSQSDHQVMLGLLVDELGYAFPPASEDQIPAANTAAHHYFPETQHVVSHAFLEAFQELGGLEIFGYPRSEFMYEDGHIVQYFQRARMEWHPKNSAGSMIQLTNLGEIYLERFDIPDSYREPQPPNAPGKLGPAGSEGGQQTAIIDLEVSASVRDAIVGPEGDQTVFVHVNSQQGQPVQNASVAVRISYPEREALLQLAPTNDRGFTKGTFQLVPSPPGQRVIVEVTARYANLSKSTQISFLRWH